MVLTTKLNQEELSEIEITNKNATMEHIKNLAFNRRASTNGETKAINYIRDQIEDKETKVEQEYFEWFSVLSILIRLVYLTFVFYAILGRLVVAVVVIFILKYSFKSAREYSIIPKEESKNLVYKVPAKNKYYNRPVIIFSAHYDSVSAILPYKVQKFFFPFYKIISVIYVGLIAYLIGWVVLDLFVVFESSLILTQLIVISTLAGMFISIPLLFIVFYDFPSKGSIDNASGVSVLIELAKIVRKNPLNNVDVIFLWTGAEEWGMKGSKSYCERHLEEFSKQYDLKNSVNINIDMVGSYIGLVDRKGFFKKRMNYNMNKIIEYSANLSDIPIDMYSKMITSQSDHKSFKLFKKKTKGKFQLVYFHSDKDTRYIHSKRDTPEKCSAEILNNCVKLCNTSIRIYDDQKLDGIIENQKASNFNF